MTDEGVSTYPRGIPARWTSSAKSGVGTALSPASRVWFTVSHGILNEIYYPRVDRACTRDLGLVVTGPGDYFSEEKRHTRHLIEPVKSGVPAYRLTNTAADGAYRIEKRILTDPSRPSVLQDIVFTPLKGEPGDYRVYALLSPHLFNCGMGNTAWIGDYKGWQMLFATGRDGVSLALAPGEVRALLGENGFSVAEKVLSVRDFLEADEIFSTGNHSKVVPIIRIEDRSLQPGPVAKKARELYWQWAHSTSVG